MWVLLASRRHPAGSPPAGPPASRRSPSGSPPAPAGIPPAFAGILPADREGTSPVPSPFRPTSITLPLSSLTCLALLCCTLPVSICHTMIFFIFVHDYALHVFPCEFGFSFNSLSMLFLYVCCRYLCIARSLFFVSRNLESTKPCRLRRTFVEMLAAVLLKN